MSDKPIRLIAADVLDDLGGRERSAVMAAAALTQCFPCGATCTPVSVGMWQPRPNGRAMFYPMCRTCDGEARGPRTARLFQQAIERRFAALGEGTR